jgi:hypothetical protein
MTLRVPYRIWILINSRRTGDSHLLGVCRVPPPPGEPKVLAQLGKSSASALEMSVGPSGGFGPLHAFGESGVEQLSILMSDGRNSCVAEAIPALHILNGRWKRPSRHERIVEAH